MWEDKKVNRIITHPQAVPPTVVEGKIGKNPFSVLLDTGADISTVHPKAVESQEYTGKCVFIHTVGGGKIEMPLAKVWLHIADYSIHLVVAVDGRAKEEVLLGRDIGTVLFDFIDEAKQRQQLGKKAESSERGKSEVVAEVPVDAKEDETERQSEALEEVKVHATRAQKLRESEERKTDEADDERDGATPVDIASINEQLIDTGIGNNDTQTEKLEDKGLELPLPELCKGSSDREELVKEQRDDESLKKARELADKELERFGWKDGLLVHWEDDIIRETRERIVVPTGRRREILKIAHSSLMDGHLSGKKTRGIISKCFT